jgi:hypothetical protein
MQDRIGGEHCAEAQPDDADQKRKADRDAGDMR